MKFIRQHEKVFIALGAGIAAYIAYSIYRAIKNGVTDLKGLVTAPFTALSNEVNSVVNTVNPSNIAAGNAAAAQIAALNNSDYAPGGTIYNQIAATQGLAAANAAWQQVQQDNANSAAQNVTANPLTWF